MDSASFSFSSQERGVHLPVRLDRGRYGSCNSPEDDTGSWRTARHTFRVAAIDRAGNGDPTPARFTFQVHTVPTRAEHHVGPEARAPCRGPRPIFGFDAHYAVRFQCRYDAPAVRSVLRLATRIPRGPPLAPGRHTFEVRGIGGTGTARARHHQVVRRLPVGRPRPAGPPIHSPRLAPSGSLAADGPRR